MRRGQATLFLVWATLHAGACYPDLGDCDDARARTPVYDDEGLPLYEGQALILASCGGGEVCHSEGALPSARIGAPLLLNFSLGLATTGPDTDAEGSARLARNQQTVYEHRHLIYRSLVRDTMPPSGWEIANLYRHADDTLAPSIDSDAGRDVVRNWLSCGAPMVERTLSPPTQEGRVGDVVSPGEARPPLPTFASLYERLFFPKCGISCHSSNVPGQLALAQLSLSTPDEAWEELLRPEGALGAFCGGEGPLVVPGDPNASLLMQKLEGTQTCGDAMPTTSGLSVTTLNAVRMWIANGALAE